LQKWFFGEWDSSKHPRGPHGQWETSTSGGDGSSSDGESSGGNDQSSTTRHGSSGGGGGDSSGASRDTRKLPKPKPGQSARQYVRSLNRHQRTYLANRLRGRR
jgi:hypothetical protein